MVRAGCNYTGGQEVRLQSRPVEAVEVVLTVRLGDARHGGRPRARVPEEQRKVVAHAGELLPAAGRESHVLHILPVALPHSLICHNILNLLVNVQSGSPVEKRHESPVQSARRSTLSHVSRSEANGFTSILLCL